MTLREAIHPDDPLIGELFALFQFIREPQDNVENGLTVLNPLLVGVVSYIMIPQFYGSFDTFSLLHLLLAVVIRYTSAVRIFHEIFVRYVDTDN
jgi:hypothetical protein